MFVTAASQTGTFVTSHVMLLYSLTFIYSIRKQNRLYHEEIHFTFNIIAGMLYEIVGGTGFE